LYLKSIYRTIFAIPYIVLVEVIVVVAAVDVDDDEAGDDEQLMMVRDDDNTVGKCISMLNALHFTRCYVTYILNFALRSKSVEITD
jgi:hypothetical protein